VLKKPSRLTNEWQQTGEQAIVGRLKDIYVTGADAIKLRDCHLPLVGTPLTEEHLPRPEAVRERHAVRHVAPRANPQVARLKVLKSDVPLDALR
jgi:hypothetical protein